MTARAEQSKLITAKKVAEMLDVSDKHVRDLADEGMPHVRVGRVYRFHWPAVQRWLLAQTKGVRK